MYACKNVKASILLKFPFPLLRSNFKNKKSAFTFDVVISVLREFMISPL